MLQAFASLASALAALAGKIVPGTHQVSNLAHPAPASPSIVQAINSLLVAKARAGASRRYLIQLRSTLKIFATGRATEPLSSITPEILEQFLANPAWTVRTRLSHWTDLRTWLNFAVRRGMLAKSPLFGVDRPRAASGPPCIFTPDQAAAVMAHAAASDPGLVPGLAFMLFAGVRPSEVERLAWPAAAAGDGLVIGSPESKTRRRRLVPILAPLRAFLDAFPPPAGPLLPVNRSERLKAIRRECGVKWGHDIMRHSFVSYALPIHGAAQVALWAGHSEAVLFSHYRELVTQADAKRFWAIRPDALPKKAF